MFLQGAGEDFKGFEVGVLGREWPERQGVIQVAEGILGGRIQLAGQSAEGECQRMFERCAAILGDGLVGDQHGEHLGLGEGHLRELVHRLGVKIAVLLGIKLQGKFQSALHEIHVAHNGAPRYFKLPGHFVAIGIGLFLGQVMKAHHPLPRRAAEGLGFGFGHIAYQRGGFCGLFPRNVSSRRVSSIPCVFSLVKTAEIIVGVHRGTL